MADRPASLVTRLGERAGRAATAAVALVVLSQVVGFSWIPVLWAVQSFTPYVLAPSIAVGVLAARHRRWPIAGVHGASVVCLIWLAAPVMWPDAPPAVGADAPRLTIAQGNVFYSNPSPGEALDALFATGADVVAITEYSEAAAALVAGDGAAARYPYLAANADLTRAGVALFSRYPIEQIELGPIGRSQGVVAVLDVAGRSVRLAVVHPQPGTSGRGLSTWSDDLATIADRFVPDDTTFDASVLVGDFNATRWHPAFRDLLDRGWTDAHEQIGQGWSASWPNDRVWPPMVRIDHALVDGGAVALAARNLTLAGSDHAGFVVELALVSRAG